MPKLLKFLNSYFIKILLKLEHLLEYIFIIKFGLRFYFIALLIYSLFKLGGNLTKKKSNK